MHRIRPGTILASAAMLGALARTAEAQFEWKPGFQWPGGQGLNDTVFSLVVFDDGKGPALYAGGAFTLAGGTAASHIARWDGRTWTAVGGGTNDRVDALTVFDDGTGPALYAGGAFTVAGGMVASHIAKWDGIAWTALSEGIGGDYPFVGALTVFDDGTGAALYAGGYFRTAGGVLASSIAKWDGMTWTPLDRGTNSSVLSLAVFDDGAGPALYVGGKFTTAGTIAANGVAKWDGTTWSALSTGVDGYDGISALTVFDDGTGSGLYAGGRFSVAGGTPANNVARWDGTTWSPLGSGIPEGHTFVFALAVFDEGTGAALYCGGLFRLAGSVVANHIAKWDGASWTSLETGTSDDGVSAIAGFDDGSGRVLFAGGYFNTAGRVASNNIAKWGAR